MDKIGYKVLCKISDYLYSFNMFSFDCKVIKYYENVWNERHKDDGPLAVFDNIKDTKKFIRNNYYCYHCKDGYLVLYKVKYVPSEERCLYYRNGDSKNDLPNGTDFANKVYLLNFLELKYEMF